MVTLWILLVVSIIEGFLEKLTKLPLPFKKFQEEVQEQNCDTALQETLPIASLNEMPLKYANLNLEKLIWYDRKLIEK